jgi:predicted nucleic acid-binding protein
MQLISSDTNVWIDFSTINRINLPFLLPYTYIMNNDAINNELIYPTTIREELLELGLVSVDLSIEEFFLAEEYGNKYPKLSKFDCIALAIAKLQNIALLTGDRQLRNAALLENVQVIGTLGILDQLHNCNLITTDIYLECLIALKNANGRAIRLPIIEIEIRLERYIKQLQK